MAAAEVVLIFGVFALHGAWPVPDVNECHYLSKAKHYWNPAWCANDFFVNTADAHQVFYWTFGWLIKWLPLEQVAWVGRLVTWALLAWTWRRLSWVVLPRAWFAVLTAGLFVLLNENAHMAGEWVIGGIEAKGFSYALVFLALEAILRERWNRAWIFLGLASSLHVIVGGWSTLAAVVAWLGAGDARPPLRKIAPGLAAGFLLALPGLWFALSLNRGVDAETVRLANDVYLKRLPHHLSADKFREGFPSRHLLLCGLWLTMVTAAPSDPAQRRLRWFASASLLLTLAGYALVGLSYMSPDIAAALLRFYWFRMTDVLIPMGVSLVGLWWLAQIGWGATTGLSSSASSSEITGGAAGQARIGPRQSGLLVAHYWVAGLALIVLGDLGFQTQHLPISLLANNAAPVVPRSDKNMNYDDWLKACEWIKNNTPPDAVFFTPRLSATLRWHAERAEVVNWKDIPQDAASIKQWAQRLSDIHGLSPDLPPTLWRESLGQLTPARLNELASQYRAHYAIVQQLPDMPRWNAKAEYENPSYAVYRLPVAVK